MGLAGMHCVRKCMCVFMLKAWNSAGIWWYLMCWNWECMCVFMLKPCNPVGIWWYFIMCWNWKCTHVFCSEFVIRCRNWVGCSELTFTAELCVQQRIWDSLPKLYCLQWICNSLPKLSCLQRINIHCRIVCPIANLGFTAEVVLSAANL